MTDDDPKFLDVKRVEEVISAHVDCDGCAVDEPETTPVQKIDLDEPAPPAPICPIPTCAQPITLRNDGKYIGAHFAKPEDIKPCPSSFQPVNKPR